MTPQARTPSLEGPLGGHNWMPQDLQQTCCEGFAQLGKDMQLAYLCSRSTSAIWKPSWERSMMLRRLTEGAPPRVSRKQVEGRVPRPTLPRNWWSCARPKRSASHTTMTLAAGTSTPTCMQSQRHVKPSLTSLVYVQGASMTGGRRWKNGAFCSSSLKFHVVKAQTNSTRSQVDYRPGYTPCRSISWIAVSQQLSEVCSRLIARRKADRQNRLTKQCSLPSSTCSLQGYSA